MTEFEDAGSPHFHGHRDRLRARFRENGASALADYELLEMAIFRAIQRGDTKPLAKALLKTFTCNSLQWPAIRCRSVTI